MTLSGLFVSLKKENGNVLGGKISLETEDTEKVLVNCSLTNFREEEKGGQNEAE